MEALNIFIKSAFIDNMIFAYFLGMCSFLAVSKKVSTAIGLGAAVIFVLGITVPINWVMQTFILNEGALSWLGASFETIDLSFLTFIMFIAIIAAMLQLLKPLKNFTTVNSTIQRGLAGAQSVFALFDQPRGVKAL